MDREVITKSEVTVEEEKNNGGGISRRSFTGRGMTFPFCKKGDIITLH